MNLLTLEDVAERLNTPVNTVRYWRAQGRGPVFFKLGKKLYTTEEDLIAWIRSARKAAQ